MLYEENSSREGDSSRDHFKGRFIDEMIIAEKSFLIPPPTTPAQLPFPYLPTVWMSGDVYILMTVSDVNPKKRCVTHYQFRILESSDGSEPQAVAAASLMRPTGCKSI